MRMLRIRAISFFLLLLSVLFNFLPVAHANTALTVNTTADNSTGGDETGLGVKS